jgi:drug/metabolite transporter (DMT)-like permease
MGLVLRRCRVLLGREHGPVSDGCRRTLEAGVMKLAAVLDLLIGAGLAWMTYGWRGELDSPDAWLAVGIALLAALMLASGASLVAGADWGTRLARASSLGGLLVGGAALVVGSVLLIGGDRQDAGSGAAKAALGLVLVLVFAIAYWVNRAARKLQVRGDPNG